MSLFEATPTNACPAYTHIVGARDGRGLAIRDHCEDLWRDYEPLADPHFCTEFPVRLHERWFEMYLTVALLRSGLEVRCPKPGPDILLAVDKRRIWIEAVCANAGAPGNPDSVPPPQYAGPGEQPVAYEVPRDQMTLRIRNSLAAKEAKFRKYIEDERVGTDDVLVVALNVHAIPWAWADMGDLMMRALYGVGDLVLTLERESGTIVGSHHEQLASINKKSSGQPVEVQPFIDGSMGHISAVLGSRADAANLPGRLGDDLVLYPNLTAIAPWPAGSIQLGEEWSFTTSADGWNGRRAQYIV